MFPVLVISCEMQEQRSPESYATHVRLCKWQIRHKDPFARETFAREFKKETAQCKIPSIWTGLYCTTVATAVQRRATCPKSSQEYKNPSQGETKCNTLKGSASFEGCCTEGTLICS